MKYLALLALAACATTAPVATAADAARAHVSLDDLNHGRALFVSHCATCHVLPKTTQSTASHVDEMRVRAHLSVDEGALIERYVVTMASR